MAASGPSGVATGQKRKSSQKESGQQAKRQRATPWQARAISTQSSSKLPKEAVSDSINLSTFLQARQFEIKALEDGMKKSKEVLSRRAFQQVPRDLRRRTASHNAKRVPGRLQEQAKREMKDDNTPTVKQGSRKGNTRSRLRADTAKRLGLLANKKRQWKEKKAAESGPGVVGRDPVSKARKGMLNHPPIPKSKFRKRQVHKTWLPTHLWHAKRSTMTPPKEPLWRFALPLTPTEKSYRPTHRAGGARGAVCWDMSYISTIGLQGTDLALEKVLRCIGVTEDSAWGKPGAKWRQGKRSLRVWASREVEGVRRAISPVTLVWEAPSINDEMVDDEQTAKSTNEKPSTRRIFIRTHPSAFVELWTEVLRTSKQQRPTVQVEDLRFDVGSIEVTGPGAFEALLGILVPYHADDEHGQLFRSLAGLTNASSLPVNALLGFSVLDPRLRYPPRRYELPDVKDEAATFSLVETLATWPADASTTQLRIFDRQARYKATRLPSQKAINRRKGQADPGEFPALTALDPEIPIMILTERSAGHASGQGTFTILAPWKCILPVWYGLVHYPLSTGNNPRHGGMLEQQQLAFEHEVPWFPTDYLASDAGWTWELAQRQKRKKAWDARPKGKRTAYESVRLGPGRKGEVGVPWNCDFELLLGLSSTEEATQDSSLLVTQVPAATKSKRALPQCVSPLRQVLKADLQATLASGVSALSNNSVAIIRITLLSTGVPQTCARIYRLPAAPNPPSDCSKQDSAPHESNISTASANSTKSQISPIDLRQQWLNLIPSTTKKPLKSKIYNAKGMKPAPVQRPKTLDEAKASILQGILSQPPLPFPKPKGEVDSYPAVPGEEDLIGFVTTGGFNLAEGKSTAIGTIKAKEVVEALSNIKDKERTLCIVRNVGEEMGRLARWEAI